MIEVTILMAVYNGMPYLPEAVESILNQTLQEFKFVIVNDGSTDGSKRYIEHLYDRRVQVLHQPNHGLGAALNRGLTYCDTEFLARMDADDVAMPKRLETQLSYLRFHQDVGLLGTQIAYLGNSGKNGFSPPLPCDNNSIYTDLRLGRHAICHPTIMCRTSLLREIRGYRTDGIGEDWDMFLRMGEVSKLANLNDLLYLYRAHPNSVNIKKPEEVRIQYAYACNCAEHREKGMNEISFEEFVIKNKTRPFWQRTVDFMDFYAQAQYRYALAKILNSHWAAGYARLAWAALCFPPRTSQWIFRALRKRRRR